MAYNDPALNINSTLVDWPIGGRPALTWSAPTATADHIIVWWNTVPDWASAGNISGSLPGSATSYTDAGSAVADGSENYYWVIAYNAGETLTGRNNGCLACQNTKTISGTLVGGTSAAQITETIDFAPVLIGGEYRSTLVVHADSWTEGFPTPSANPGAGIPYPPGEANLQAGLAVTTPIPTTFAGVLQLLYIAPGDPPGPPGGYLINAPSAPTSSSLSEADAFNTFITATNPATVSISLTGNGPGSAWGTPGVAPFASALADVRATAQVSYATASASLANGGAGPGGASALPPAPVVNIQYLEMPLPIPLPCVPCCSTAAPICDCSSNHDR